MTALTDILLGTPIPTGWLHALLLIAFAFHFLFVLLTLGTGFLATLYYVAGRWSQRETLRSWDREWLEVFFAHKSLAIVLGVGPILMMQVGNSVPFLTGVNFAAPLWMLIIVCLILSLVLYEWQHLRTRERPWFFLLITTLALGFLLYVPATFVTVLVATENPEAWPRIFQVGGGFPQRLSAHWLLRFLHVLGASVVVTAAVHYIRKPDLDEERRRHLLGWMAGGLGFQFLVGVGLFASVRPIPGALPTVVTLVGVASAGTLGFVAASWRKTRWPNGLLVGTLLSFILLPMFLARQILQDRVLLPVERVLRHNAVAYGRMLEPYRQGALTAYNGTLAVAYDEPLAIYSRSCGPCHGAVGNGRGEAAPQLEVAPEDLTALRVTDRRLDEILRQGIDGTAMPIFDFYLESELSILKEFLRNKIGLAAEVERVSNPPGPAPARAAQDLFWGTCAVCHGTDGHGTDRGRLFLPPVPDLTVLTTAPNREFSIITEGYPGTMMRSYRDVPEDVRRGLVVLVHGFYIGGKSGSRTAISTVPSTSALPTPTTAPVPSSSTGTAAIAAPSASAAPKPSAER